MTRCANRNFAILTPFLVTKNCLYDIVQAEKHMLLWKKSNVPYGSATLKGCTAPADLCTSKYVDGAGIEPTSLHYAHSVMFHPRILPAQIKKDVLFSRTITSYHDTTLNKDTTSITG